MLGVPLELIYIFNSLGITASTWWKHKQNSLGTTKWVASTLLGCSEVIKRSLEGAVISGAFLWWPHSPKCNTKLSTREEGRGPACPQLPKGCFINGFSSGHSTFRPSFHWLEKLQVQFSSKRAVNLWCHMSEREKEGESKVSCWSLWSCDSVQLWPLTREGQGSETLVTSTNTNHSISAALRAESTPWLCSRKSGPCFSLKQIQLPFPSVIASEPVSLPLARPCLTHSPLQPAGSSWNTDLILTLLPPQMSQWLPLLWDNF